MKEKGNSMNQPENIYGNVGMEEKQPPPIIKNVCIKYGRIAGRDEAILPKMCVKCCTSEGDMKRYRKSIDWCSPVVLFILFLCGLLPLLLVYFLIRKRIHVSFWLCEKHARRYEALRKINLVVWVLFLLLLGCSFAFSEYENVHVFWIAAFSTFIIGLGTAIAGSSPVQVHEYREGWFLFKGINRDMISTLD